MRVVFAKEQAVTKYSSRYQGKEAALDDGRRVEDVHEQFHEHLVGQDCARGNNQTENRDNEGIASCSLPIERCDGKRFAELLCDLIIDEVPLPQSLHRFHNDAVMLSRERNLVILLWHSLSPFSRLLLQSNAHARARMMNDRSAPLLARRGGARG